MPFGRLPLSQHLVAPKPPTHPPTHPGPLKPCPTPSRAEPQHLIADSLEPGQQLSKMMADILLDSTGLVSGQRLRQPGAWYCLRVSQGGLLSLGGARYVRGGLAAALPSGPAAAAAADGLKRVQAGLNRSDLM